jgi:hypothetical protein
MTPAAVADLVADAVSSGRFWVFPSPEFVEVALARWHSIAEGLNPERSQDMPGMPPTDEIVAKITEAFSPPSS